MGLSAVRVMLCHAVRSCARCGAAKPAAHAPGRPHIALLLTLPSLAPPDQLHPVLPLPSPPCLAALCSCSRRPSPPSLSTPARSTPPSACAWQPMSSRRQTRSASSKPQRQTLRPNSECRLLHGARASLARRRHWKPWPAGQGGCKAALPQEAAFACARTLYCEAPNCALSSSSHVCSPLQPGGPGYRAPAPGEARITFVYGRHCAPACDCTFLMQLACC